MSEEQSTQNGCTEMKLKITLLTILTILSLLISIPALVLSIINYNGGATQNQQASADKNAISKKYDKGKSLEKAFKTGKPVIVFFYTDWCGFCQRFAPVYDKISKNAQIKKEFAIAYVNCENSENQKYMEEYNVQGYPTVYVIKTDGTKKQLENSTFFNDDSETVVAKNALEIIGK